MEGYTAKIRDGREIYIPYWPVDVSLENLAKAGKYLGSSNLVAISELNIPAVIVAIMDSKEPNQSAALIKHFICQVRIDGAKIESGSIDSMFVGDLKTVAELFAHVIAAQYADFFASGLAKEVSPVD